MGNARFTSSTVGALAGGGWVGTILPDKKKRKNKGLSPLLPKGLWFEASARVEGFGVQGTALELRWLPVEMLCHMGWRIKKNFKWIKNKFRLNRSKKIEKGSKTNLRLGDLLQKTARLLGIADQTKI